MTAGIPLLTIVAIESGGWLMAAGREATRPNGFIVVLYLGGASLAVGVSLGLGVLIVSWSIQRHRQNSRLSKSELHR